MKQKLLSWKLSFLALLLTSISWADHGNVSTPEMPFLGIWKPGYGYLPSPTTQTVKEGFEYVFNLKNVEESGICIGQKDKMHIQVIISERPILMSNSGHDDFTLAQVNPSTLGVFEVEVKNPGDIIRVDKILPCLLTQNIYYYWRLKKKPWCYSERYSPWGSGSNNAETTNYYQGLDRLPQAKCKGQDWDLIYPRVARLGFSGGAFNSINSPAEVVPQDAVVNWYKSNPNGTRGIKIYTTIGDAGFSPNLVSSNLLSDLEKENGGTFYYTIEYTCLTRLKNYLSSLGVNDPTGSLNNTQETNKGSVRFVRLPDIQAFIQNNGLTDLQVTRTVYNTDGFSAIDCPDQFRCKVKDLNFVHLNNLYFASPVLKLFEEFPELTGIDRFNVEFDWLDQQGGNFIEMGEQFMTQDPTEGPHQRRICYSDVEGVPSGRYYRVKYFVTFEYRLDINDQDEAGGPYTDKLTVDCNFHIDYLVIPNSTTNPFDLVGSAYAAYGNVLKYEDQVANYIQDVLGLDPDDELCDLIGGIILPIQGTLGGIVPSRDGGNGGTIEPDPNDFVEFIDQCTKTGSVRLPAEEIPLDVELNDPVLNDLMNQGKLNFKWVDQVGNILSNDLVFDYPNLPSNIPNLLTLEVSIDDAPFIKIHQTAVYNSCLSEPITTGLRVQNNPDSSTLSNIAIHQYLRLEDDMNRSINEKLPIDYNNFNKYVSKLKINNLNNVLVFPNPVQINEEIQILNCPENSSIFMTNVQGMRIEIEIHQNGNSMSIKPSSEISSGMYFINIISSNDTKGIAIQINK